MTFEKTLPGFAVLSGLAFSLIVPSPSARANVYATNVKLNGDYTNVVCAQGTGLSISYLLNEPATLGVAINILSGSNSVRTISVPAGSPGALRGTNSVFWDGLDFSSNNVPGGTYSVAVTALAAGFTNWTQTSVDTNPGNYVWEPEGIAVDQNRASRYFGRVFIGNADTNPQGTNVGDHIGILKLNADASPAEESPTNWVSTGGYVWSGGNVSPWKIQVSADDRVYIMDEGSSPPGLIYNWDPTISTNYVAVLQPDNLGDSGAVIPNGMALSGSGTNSELFIADTRDWLGFGPSGSLGIIKYNLLDGACATNDTGITVVATHDNPDGSSTGTNLDESPYDVALDPNQNLYVIQYIEPIPPDNLPDVASRVLRFPAYNPSASGGAPEITPTWYAGSLDDSYDGAAGVAVDPTATYVAVALVGLTNGNFRILSATNGALLADLDLDTNAPATHYDTACAWDAAGNAYVTKYYDPPNVPGLVAPGLWKVFSPPGSNQATTIAPETVQVTTSAAQPPVITQITESNGQVVLTFTAGPGESPATFNVLGATTVNGQYTLVSGASVTAVSPGVFQASFPSSQAHQFYRIEIAGSFPPMINALTVSESSVLIDFTGGQTDYPWYFHLQSAGSPGGPFVDISGASATAVSPGLFKFTTPANGDYQFYRIRR